MLCQARVPRPWRQPTPGPYCSFPVRLAQAAGPGHLFAMALGTPRMTFGELAREALEIEVVCPNCNHRRVIDGNVPTLRNRRVAGARFRCEKCGSVGLPEIGKQRLWVDRLTRHSKKLS